MRNINIQDGFLFQSLKEGRELDVVLTTGKSFKGVRLKRFDRFAVVLAIGTQEVLVYKHAIVLISDVAGAPARTRGWNASGGERQGPSDPRSQPER